MEALLVIYETLSLLIYVFDFLLLVRAVCSWVPNFRDSMVYNFSFRITEPLLAPIRKFMWRFDFARRCPLDLSFLVLVLLTTLADKLLGYLFLNLLYY